MSSPLGPAEKEDIQKLDNQLGDLIKDVKEGRQNEGGLFSIAQQLESLSTNNQIPDSVKEKMLMALHDLHSMPSDRLTTVHLIAAKKEIDDVLEQS